MKLVKPENIDEILPLSRTLDSVQQCWIRLATPNSVGANGWFALESVKLLAEEVIFLRKEIQKLKGE